LVEGIDLDRFNFSFPIPSTAAPREWHRAGFIRNYIYAEIFGSPVPPRSTKPSSPSLLSRLNPFAPPPTSVYLPALPAYSVEEKEITRPEDTLKGAYFSDRTIRLIYNSDPWGYVNTLNEHSIGESKDIGAYDIRVFSDVVR
jgi:hypothetical protein